MNTHLDVMCFQVYNDELLAGTTSGLFKLNLDTNQWDEVPLRANLDIIRDLVVWQGQLLVGGTHGFIRMSESLSLVDQVHYGEDSFLPDPRINVFKVLDNRHLLVGTWGGLVEVTDMDMTIYESDVNDNLLVPMVNIIEESVENDSLIIGSYNVRKGGLTLLYSDTIRYYDKDARLATVNYTAAILSKGLLYIGGGMYESGGLNILELNAEGQWEVMSEYHETDGLSGPKVRSLYLLKDQLLIGSEYDGLAVMSLNDDGTLRNTGQVYSDMDGLPNNEVKSIIVYHDNLYFGTKSGIGRMNVGMLNNK